MESPLKELVLVMLEGAFTGKGWQGATLNGSLRGISARQALWRPGPGRRCIWEHVLHASYWKHSVIRALSGGEPPAFERSPSNWPRVPDGPDERQWKLDRAYLAKMHAALRDAACHADPGDFFKKTAGRKWRWVDYACGVAAHDAYHTGQIQLLKRLMRT